METEGVLRALVVGEKLKLQSFAINQFITIPSKTRFHNFVGLLVPFGVSSANKQTKAQPLSTLSKAWCHTSSKVKCCEYVTCLAVELNFKVTLNLSRLRQFYYVLLFFATAVKGLFMEDFCVRLLLPSMNQNKRKTSNCGAGMSQFLHM